MVGGPAPADGSDASPTGPSRLVLRSAGDADHRNRVAQPNSSFNQCRRPRRPGPTLLHWPHPPPGGESPLGGGGFCLGVGGGPGLPPTATTTDNTIKLWPYPTNHTMFVCSGSHSGCKQLAAVKPSAF